MKYNFYPFDYKKFLIVRGNKAVVKTAGYPMPEVVKDSYFESISKNMQYMMDGHFCGYVAIPKWKIPMSWWSHYDADGLQYLSIHGGISYCHTETNLWIIKKLIDILQIFNRKVEQSYIRIFKVSINIERETENLRELFDALDPSESWKKKEKKPKKKENRLFNYFAVKKFFDRVNKLIEGIFGEIVIFGFDCAHAGDEDDENLKDHKIVMLMTEQMERQLLDFAKVYNTWLKASRDDRLAIMDKIRSGEKFNTGFGFGAMIDLLCGAREFGKGGKDAEVKQLKKMWKRSK